MNDDRDWWQLDGAHCRELTTWLRDVAQKCRLPDPQRELLAVAERYERRADYVDRRAARTPQRLISGQCIST